MFDIWNVLDSDNYVVVNRDVIQIFGLESAVLLGELASEFRYYERQGMLQDGRFFTSVANVEERTGLNEYKQRKCLKALQDKGVVTVQNQKHPNRRWIELNGKALTRELQNLKDRGQKFKGQKSKIYGSVKNNKERKTKEDYICQDAKDVIDYLNEMTGKRFRHSEASLKNVRARLNEGFTVDDCKTVIEKKASEWMGTDFESFLRPSTLFAPSHFEDYLNQRMVSKTESHDDRYRKANASYDIDDIERIMSE